MKKLVAILKNDGKYVKKSDLNSFLFLVKKGEAPPYKLVCKVYILRDLKQKRAAPLVS